MTEINIHEDMVHLKMGPWVSGARKVNGIFETRGKVGKRKIFNASL